jgi:hypothetical protein
VSTDLVHRNLCHLGLLSLLRSHVNGFAGEKRNEGIKRIPGARNWSREVYVGEIVAVGALFLGGILFVISRSTYAGEPDSARGEIFTRADFCDPELPT